MEKNGDRIKFRLDGEIGRRIGAVTEQWIYPAPLANPDMLEMFRDQDRLPLRDRVPWAGEFAGKYLTHTVQIYRLAPSTKLKKHIAWFASEMISLQAKDGYLGPWPKGHRLTNWAPNCSGGSYTWDAWGHYHAMLGLLLWYQESKDKKALECACRIGDMFCDKYLKTGNRLGKTGSEEMNLAPIHSLCLLYKETGEQRYLDMAREIEKDFEIPTAGDYIRAALAGKEFYQTPKPRWESLHPIMGISELYHITGEEKYRRAFEQIWWSIAKTDRHNNGGFSSGEQAQGNPYHTGPIETCCTIAWMAMSVEMLRLTGDSTVADEIELSTFNSGIGMMNPSGRWVTYNTPMDGERRASAHDIVFQARAGQPELNCCSVNGPRALGMISDWALTVREGELALNYYGPGKFETSLPSGNPLTIVEQTDYPRDNKICVVLKMKKKERFALSLRIPYWSQKTSVKINSKKIPQVQSGKYLRLDRIWSPGDRITLELDFRPHFWVADQKYKTVSHNWQTEWQVFGPIPNNPDNPSEQSPGKGKDPMPWDSLKDIPRSMKADGKELNQVKVLSECGCIDFRRLLGKASPPPPIAYAFTEIEMDRDDVLPIVFGADWWASWFVNGVKVYDNHATGGNGGFTSERNNRVDLPLRKGKNLVAVRVTSGSGGWSLTIGKGELLSKSRHENGHLCPASIYRGPILLAYDPRFNPGDDNEIPTLDSEHLSGKTVESDSWMKPWLLMELPAENKSILRLCDFGSAGATGRCCQSWLPVRFPFKPQEEFSRKNPLRSFRVE